MADFDDDELKHYGVPGMRWGVRKSDIEKFSDFGREIKKDLIDKGVDVEALKSKYGPPNEDALGAGTTGRLTLQQKQLLIAAGAGLVGAAAITYYVKKNGLAVDALSPTTLFNTRMAVYNKAEISGLSGLDMHWNKGVNLPSGTILPRISSVKEVSVRAGGFYSAFEPDDVDRYKAILPTFWEGWGIGSPAGGGFVNQYKSSVPIKAPSGSETLSIFKNLLSTDANFRSSVGILSVDTVNSFSDSGMRTLFQSNAALWADFEHSSTKTFFEAVKSQGYNAVIDFNDAGALSKTPLRVIDGSIFDIVGHEPLTLKDMLAASERVNSALAHALQRGFNLSESEIMSSSLNEREDDSESTLLHYGVPGMRWGKRKMDDSIGVSAKTSREARKDASEFARAKMFYGEGAGTRRKLINATVNAKSSKDPDYKKAFDAHVARQDMSKHASKARSERKRKNISNTTTKTARGVRHIINGNSQFASLTAVVVAGAGAAFLKNGGMDKVKQAASSTKLNDLKNHRSNMKAAQDLLRGMGL